MAGRFFEIFSFFFPIDAPREVMFRPSDVSQKGDGSFKDVFFGDLYFDPYSPEN